MNLFYSMSMETGSTGYLYMRKITLNTRCSFNEFSRNVPNFEKDSYRYYNKKKMNSIVLIEQTAPSRRLAMYGIAHIAHQ